MENTNKIKGRLRLLRRSLGMTQEQFAEILGISQSTYANIEKGNKSNLTLGQALLLHERLKINPNWLLLGQGERYLKEEPVPQAPIVEEEKIPYQMKVKKTKGSQAERNVSEEVRRIKEFLKLKFPDFEQE